MKKEKRVRNLSWEDYGISKPLQSELKAFCLQYDEKKQKIRYFVHGTSYVAGGKSNNISNPTENRAIENIRFKRDCEIIEEAARKTDRELAPYLLKSVTKNLSYEYLEYDQELGRIPVGKTDFYGYRRRFFYYLQKLKNGDK